MPDPGFYIPIIGQNIDRTVILSAVVYFLAGLALISQGQLALLRARWTLQKTPSSPSILRNWPIYALILVLTMGFIAALMPLGGTFHLALILRTIIEGAWWVLIQIFGTMIALFMLLGSLFTGEPPEEQAPTPEPLPQFTPVPPPIEPPVQLPPWTGGAIFWIVAALLLGYAAYIYFGGRGLTFGWLRQLWQMLSRRLGQITVAYQDWQATHLRSKDETDDSSAARRRGRLLGWLGYRGLDPDAQVRYYYLSMLEQAEEAGHTRQQHETPGSYAQRLIEELTAEKASADIDGDDVSPQAIAEADDDRDSVSRQVVHSLTDAFVRVRYADEHFKSDDARALRSLWEQLKRLLRL